MRADGSPSATLLRRTQAAFACGGVAARYIPTGAAAGGRPSEASVMAGLLRGWGVPDGQLTLEETGTDTLSSAVACAALAGAGPVRVATSAYHLRRCVWLLRILGVDAAACPPPPVRSGAYWVVRDWAATVMDVPLALLRRQR